MSQPTEYDLIVIGTGPGGEAAAMMGVKNSLRVMVVDSYFKVGGGCVHWGTIPSKTIRECLIMFRDIAKIPYLGNHYNHTKLDFSDLLKSSQMVINSQEKMRDKFYSRNDVPVIHGWAKFKDANTVEVVGKQTSEFYTAKNFLVATGSSPYRPDDIDFSNPHILDSDKVLQVGDHPASIAVYGAGIVGVEYACMFKNLGIKVDLINNRDRVLDFLDTEITDAFNHYMREEGITIRNKEEYERIEVKDDMVHVYLKSGKLIKHKYLLWAQGRVGNSKNMGLEEIGVEINDRGHIVVDDDYRSSVSNLFAVGDIVGWPSLAATAYDQGKNATMNILGIEGKRNTLKLFPVGIYTSPEISYIGQTEKELTDQKVPYEVGKVQYSNLARAQIVGDTRGMLKILFHRETLEVLGVHCFGRNASEIIHIGQAVMNMPEGHNTIEYFLYNTMNYPTMSEAYRIAAQNGINRL